MQMEQQEEPLNKTRVAVKVAALKKEAKELKELLDKGGSIEDFNKTIDRILELAEEIQKLQSPGVP